MKRVESVNVGRVRPTPHGKLKRTAIDKRAVDGPVWIGELGLDGDEIADLVHHGGPDKAVYAFAREDYAHWEAELGRPLDSGVFGENLTTSGLDIQHARMGERWRVGEALLEVASVRIPCSVFAGFVDEPRWVKRFTAHGVPGAYLRVLEQGHVTSGAPIVVVERPDHDLTVGLVFRACTTERALLSRFAEEPRISVSLRQKATTR
ncbi:molybdenum cofactor biosysynthesis protein [Aeromicrobium sp. PE09-221]|uniref:MOSC domain-containing protein n=1 Tax=Aeromicrobium sp. PE09-221 TaxID=1898043 RepID=UPI000B3E5519|nr:MOSC domain-containing protein [Aeromicrobium sp. PE09-221]OUZ07269.1 molybdenum cofactor biosysynthesis protein [Aeromicrobium sp. PE09-221]